MEKPPAHASQPLAASHGLISFEIMTEIAIIDQLAQAQAEKQLSPAINMPQFIVLNHLYRTRQSVSMVSIATAIQVSKGAISHTVTKLLEKNWVISQPDPSDGRGKLVSLTEAGLQVRDVAVQKLIGDMGDLSHVLTETEMLQMFGFLKKTRTWFDQKRAV